MRPKSAVIIILKVAVINKIKAVIELFKRDSAFIIIFSYYILKISTHTSVHELYKITFIDHQNMNLLTIRDFNSEVFCSLISIFAINKII